MSKKRNYKKKKNNASKLDIAVVSIMVLSILLAVLIYTKSGVVGLKLNEILRWFNGNNAIHTTYRNFCNCYKACL